MTKLMSWDVIISRNDLGTVHALAHNVVGYTKTSLFTTIEALLAESRDRGLKEVTF